MSKITTTADAFKAISVMSETLDLIAGTAAHAQASGTTLGEDFMRAVHDLQNDIVDPIVLYRFAKVMFEAGSPENAEELIRKHIDHYSSNDMEVELLLVDILMARGKYDEAIEILEPTITEGMSDSTISSENAADFYYQCGSRLADVYKHLRNNESELEIALAMLTIHRRFRDNFKERDDLHYRRKDDVLSQTRETIESLRGRTRNIQRRINRAAEATLAPA